MAKKVRYTIDLTQEVNSEIQEIADEAGIPKSEVFRRALGLLKLTHKAVRNGEHVGIGRSGSDSLKTEFVLT